MRSPCGAVRVQRLGQGAGVLQGEGGAGADGVVGGVGGVAEQDGVAAVPGAVGEGAEGEPRGGAVGPGAAKERVAVEHVGEQLLQQGAAVGLARPVQAESGPGLGGALDDDGAAVGGVGVAVAPDPAVVGLDEGEGEGVEGLGGAEPDVAVAAVGEVAAVVVRVAGADGAVDAVARDDEVGVGERAVGGDLVLVRDRDAEGGGTGGEEVEETVATDAEALVAVVDGGAAAEVGGAVAPADGVGAEGVGGDGVVGAEAVEEGDQ